MTYQTKILVQRTASVGDVIMATAVVRELHERHNECVIDVVTDCIEVFAGNDRVRNLYLKQNAPSANDYDLFVNLDDAYECGPHENAHFTSQYFVRAFGAGVDNESWYINTDPEIIPNKSKKVIDDLTTLDDKFIVVHMRNWHWQMKNIPMQVWFDTFEKLFSERADFKVVCVGGKTDHFVDHPLFVDARDRYTLQELAAIISHAECFVGIDSAPYHVAVSTGIPIVGLLTHLQQEQIMPHNGEYGDYIAIQTGEDCAGCYNEQETPVRQVVCKKGNYPCVNNFNPQKIADAILNFIEDDEE